jgi:hypothetical protein
LFFANSLEDLFLAWLHDKGFINICQREEPCVDESLFLCPSLQEARRRRIFVMINQECIRIRISASFPPKKIPNNPLLETRAKSPGSAGSYLLSKEIPFPLPPPPPTHTNKRTSSFLFLPYSYHGEGKCP